MELLNLSHLLGEAETQGSGKRAQEFSFLLEVWAFMEKWAQEAGQLAAESMPTLRRTRGA